MLLWNDEEQLDRVVIICLARFGSYTTENNCSKRSSLQYVQRLVLLLSNTTHDPEDAVIQLTVVSSEACICSTKPISNISGLEATQLLAKCSSARERTLLSVDCRADSNCASSACASAGRTDIVGMYVGWKTRWSQWIEVRGIDRKVETYEEVMNPSAMRI